MKLKIIMATLFLATILSSCSTTQHGIKYKYTYSLIDSKKNESEIMRFEDSTIAVDFVIDTNKINFTMKNKSKTAIKINWNETVFIKNGKACGGVIHSGVKYVDKNSHQLMSVIPAGIELGDAMFPTEKINFRYGQYNSVANGWVSENIFYTNDLGNPDIKIEILGNKGKKFSVYMPVLSNSSQKEYMFNFKVLNVEQSDPNDKPHNPKISRRIIGSFFLLLTIITIANL